MDSFGALEHEISGISDGTENRNARFANVSMSTSILKP